MTRRKQRPETQAEVFERYAREHDAAATRAELEAASQREQARMWREAAARAAADPVAYGDEP